MSPRARQQCFSSAVRNEPIQIWGDGSVVRDYVHIQDGVEAFFELAVIRWFAGTVVFPPFSPTSCCSPAFPRGRRGQS